MNRREETAPLLLNGLPGGADPLPDVGDGGSGGGDGGQRPGQDDHGDSKQKAGAEDVGAERGVEGHPVSAPDLRLGDGVDLADVEKGEDQVRAQVSNQRSRTRVVVGDDDRYAAKGESCQPGSRAPVGVPGGVVAEDPEEGAEEEEKNEGVLSGAAGERLVNPVGDPGSQGEAPFTPGEVAGKGISYEESGPGEAVDSAEEMGEPVRERARGDQYTGSKPPDADQGDDLQLSGPLCGHQGEGRGEHHAEQENGRAPAPYCVGRS